METKILKVHHVITDEIKKVEYMQNRNLISHLREDGFIRPGKWIKKRAKVFSFITSENKKIQCAFLDEELNNIIQNLIDNQKE